MNNQLDAQKKPSSNSAPVHNQLQSRPFASVPSQVEKVLDSTVQASTTSRINHSLNKISILPQVSAVAQPIQKAKTDEDTPIIEDDETINENLDAQGIQGNATPGHDGRELQDAGELQDNEQNKVTRSQKIKYALKNAFEPHLKEGPQRTGYTAPVSEWTHQRDVGESRKQMSLPKKVFQSTTRTAGFIGKGLYDTPKMLLAEAVARGIHTAGNHDIDTFDRIGDAHGKGIRRLIGGRKNQLDSSKILNETIKRNKRSLENPTITDKQRQDIERDIQRDKNADKHYKLGPQLRVILDPRTRDFYGDIDYAQRQRGRNRRNPGPTPNGEAPKKEVEI